VGPVLANGNNLAGLAFTKDGRLYAALQQNPGKVVELDPTNAAVLRTVVNFNNATALATDPISGDLFVSNFDGVQRISNFANGPGTLTPYFSSGFTDGIVFAPDGTLYVKSGCCPDFVARVAGTNTASPGATTIIAYVDEGDGMALESNPADSSKPFLYVNRTNGIITRIDTSALPATPTDPCGSACTDIYTGGTRGDFVTVGPDGCLYATQSERVIKVTKADGSCSLLPVNPAPQLVLAPQTITPSPAQGTPETFTASFRNLSVPTGTPVTLTVIGPNLQALLERTDATGQATFTYAGTFTGTDALVATATVDTQTLTSNVAQVTWTAGPHTTFLSLNTSRSSGTPNTPLPLTATLVDVSASPAVAVPNVTLHFALAGQTCTGTTDSTGTASCALTPHVATGAYPLNADFLGTSFFLASSASKGVDLVTGAPVQQGFKNGDFCTYSKGAFAGRGVPGQFFDHSFLTTFARGLTLGDPTDTSPTDTKHDATWTATPTGQSALKTYLTSAAGGANTALTTDTTNATSTSGGELPRQTAAFTLNVGFDNANVSGGTDPGLFGDLTLCHLAAGSVIGSWTLSAAQAAALNGKSVSQVLTATNNALGSDGLPAYATPCGTNCNQGMGELNQLVTQLNTSFDACVVSSFATAFLCK